jgi:hypothetical protein
MSVKNVDRVGCGKSSIFYIILSLQICSKFVISGGRNT